jgi:hypothetical protein
MYLGLAGPGEPVRDRDLASQFRTSYKIPCVSPSGKLSSPQKEQVFRGTPLLRHHPDPPLPSGRSGPKTGRGLPRACRTLAPTEGSNRPIWWPVRATALPMQSAQAELAPCRRRIHPLQGSAPKVRSGPSLRPSLRAFARGRLPAPLPPAVHGHGHGSPDRASGGSGSPGLERPRRGTAIPRKKVHRGFRCTPRMAGSGGGFTMRETVSCTSAGAGCTGLPWGRRERQADGSPAAGHPHFFWNTFPAAAPRGPPFRLHPMRDPANRPLAGTSSGTPPAFSRVQASPDRASGIRGGRLRSACGRRSAPGRGRGWRDRYLPKNSHGPLPRFHPSAVPDASTHALSNPRPPPCPDTIPLHRGSSRPWRA